MKLSGKWTTIALALLFIVIGAYVFIVSFGFPKTIGATLGPGYLPRLLAVFMVGCALLSLLIAVKKPDTLHEIPYIKYLLLILTFLFLYVWALSKLNYYFASFIFLACSFFVLNRGPNKKKAFIQAGSLSVFLICIIYVAFGLILHIF